MHMQYTHTHTHCVFLEYGFCRYNYKVRVPLSSTLFRLLPLPLREGKEIKVCAVLLTQGINEQQTMADTYVSQYVMQIIN